MSGRNPLKGRDDVVVLRNMLRSSRDQLQAARASGTGREQKRLEKVVRDEERFLLETVNRSKGRKGKVSIPGEK